MSNRSDEGESSGNQRLQQLERRLDRITSWLSSELGYETSAEGNVNRLMKETHNKATQALNLLRGENEQIGLVGKVELLFRSWHVLLSLIAALGGYIVRMITES